MTILNIILPVFAIIMTGYIAGRTNIVPKSGLKTLNNFVFYIALPALLFLSTATAPIEQLMHWPFIAANVGGIFASFFLAVLMSKFLFQRSTQACMIYGMNTSYGTTGYMGIPLVIAAFGSEAALPAALATLIHNIPVITFVLLVCEATQVLEHKGTSNWRQLLLKILKPIMTSPLTISVLLGISVAAIGMPLPQAILNFSQLLANASGATALFAIGLSLVGQFSLAKNSKQNIGEIGTIIMLKLLFQPFITLLFVVYVFHLDPLWAVVSVIMSALPVGAGVFVFAQKYEKLTTPTLIATFVSLLISIVTLSVIFMYIERFHII